jgi:hypothetical protein
MVQGQEVTILAKEELKNIKNNIKIMIHEARCHILKNQSVREGIK